MGRNLFNIFITGGTTLGSRILGLLRDILIFSFFGASALHSAFIVAFMLPNLFRRLLGEGALVSALVPILSGEVEGRGRRAGFHLLNKVLSRVGLLLLGLTIVGMALLVGVQGLPELAPRWRQAAHLGVILMPYMPLVCFAAVLGGALNVLGRFAATAFSSVWLNLAMIAALGILAFVPASSSAQIYYLCSGVLAGGILQVGAAAWALSRQGWRPYFDWRLTERLTEIRALWAPGLVGAVVLQVNVLVSRLLAFGLNDGAVAFLYLANRLMELPLGVFTIAVATVVFPNLARFAAKGDAQEFVESFHRGLWWVMAVTVPAALGLLLLRQPIVAFLFEWGRFDVSDVLLAGPVVGVFALGLPFYSLAILATRGLHALKDTRTTALGAGLSFSVNLGLSLLLMHRWGMEGLAAANVLAAGVQGGWLYVRLKQRIRLFWNLPHGSHSKDRIWENLDWRRPLLRIGLATTGMSIVCLGGLEWIGSVWGSGKLAAMIAVMGMIPLAAAVYFILFGLLRFVFSRNPESG